MIRRFKRVLTVAGVAVLTMQCAEANGDLQEREAADSAAAPVQGTVRIINVETQPVEPGLFVDYIRITGEAEARHDLVLSAEEGGMLAEFTVAKGRRVRAGQVIARIEASVLSAQVDEARAASALAAEQYARQRRLWEDEGIGTEIAFLQAKYQAEMAAARLATLEARLAKTEIAAPVGGIFDEEYADPGEIVLPGGRIARLVSTSQIKVAGGVPERYAPSVRAGSESVVTFDIMPGREFRGTISFVGSTVEEASRTFPIEILLDNPDGLIKPRMVANVQLVRERREDAIVVSQDHVVRSETGYHVYVVGGEGNIPIARTREVTLGPSYGGRVVIASGLEVGDEVITLGSQLVDNGSRIRIISRGPEGGADD